MKPYLNLLLAILLTAACQERPAGEKKPDLLMLTFSRNVVTTDPEMIRSIYRIDTVNPATLYFRSLKYARQLVTVEKNLNLTLVSMDPAQPAVLYSLPAGYDQRMINDIEESLSWLDNVRVAKSDAKIDLSAFTKVDDPAGFWSLPPENPADTVGTGTEDQDEEE